MNHLTEILVVDRFEPLGAHLLELLSGLDEEHWNRATAAPRWSVKDVTAHLLGGDIGYPWNLIFRGYRLTSALSTSTIAGVGTL